MTDSYLDTNGERQPYYEPPTPRAGGYFEDETGWWCLDALEANTTTGALEGGWFVGRDGQERWVDLEKIPQLTYCED